MASDIADAALDIHQTQAYEEMEQHSLVHKELLHSLQTAMEHRKSTIRKTPDQAKERMRITQRATKTEKYQSSKPQPAEETKHLRHQKLSHQEPTKQALEDKEYEEELKKNRALYIIHI